MTAPVDREEELIQEALDAEMEETRIEITDGALLSDLVTAFRSKRHPGDFYGEWPSNEQLSYFVRGGR